MSQEFTDTNRKWWNERAATYNAEPWQKEMSSRIAAFVIANKNLLDLPEPSGNAPTARLLDYACGTGMITLALAPSLREAVGIDLAPNMVARYNDTFQQAPPDAHETFSAHAVEGNLLTEETPTDAQYSSSNMYNFDAAAIGLGFHHFPTPELSVTRLAERVKPGGGVVGIVDFVKDGGEFPMDHGGTVSQHGFSEQEMRDIFEGAGMGDVKWAVIDEAVVFGGKDGKKKEMKVFLATAKRA